MIPSPSSMKTYLSTIYHAPTKNKNTLIAWHGPKKLYSPVSQQLHLIYLPRSGLGHDQLCIGTWPATLNHTYHTQFLAQKPTIITTKVSWRNGSAFDSRSKGYPFKSGWDHEVLLLERLRSNFVFPFLFSSFLCSYSFTKKKQVQLWQSRLSILTKDQTQPG